MEEIINQLQNKIRVDTGLDIDLSHHIVFPKMAKIAIDSQEPFILCAAENFFVEECFTGCECEMCRTLNPGMVFLRNNRNIAFTVIPFIAIERTWSPGSGFSR